MISIKTGQQNGAEDKLIDMVATIKESLSGAQSLTGDLSKTIISLENADDTAALNFTTAVEDLDSIIGVALESVIPEDTNVEDFVYRADAAAAGALMAIDPMVAMEQEIVPPSSDSKMTRVIGDLGFSPEKRNLAIESYDDRCGQDMISHSMSYNLVSTSPSDFVQTMYPLVVINPGDTGVRCTANLLYIQDDTARDLNGKLANFNKRSLTRAFVDGSIISSDKTRIIPVWSAQSADKFVDDAVVPHTTILHEGESVDTSYLKFGERLDLLGISQTPDLLARGVLDHTDQLDIDNKITSILVKFDADIIEFPVSGINSARFVPSRQEESTGYNLAFSSPSLSMDAATQTTALVDPVTLAVIKTDDLVVHFRVDMSGTLNVSNGDLVVYGLKVEVVSVVDAAGDQLPLTSGTGAAIAAIVDAATTEMLGYKIDSRRTNSNRRQRGDIVGHDCYTEMLFLPLGAPITSVRPTNTDKDTSDLSTLVATTHLRMANDAVQSLNETAAMLNDYHENGVTTERPDVLGIGRLFVQPTFVPLDLDVLAAINSISSFERAADAKAVLVNAVREVATRMYIQSEYQAARNVLNPTENGKVTVVIATDPHIASHLFQAGDDRLMTDLFNFKVVTSPNKDMKGKIFLSFSNFDENRGVKPDPLSFGFTGYAPEVVFNLNVTRNGATSRELAVYPRHKCFNTMPVLGQIIVENLEEAVTNTTGSPW